jgi:hypothetical protein
VSSGLVVLIVCALALLAVLHGIYDGPICVQCGGRGRHRRGCPADRDER